MAVQSHWFSVGSVVSWARAGVGAVATQANVEAGYGPRGLALMAERKGAPEALEALLKEDPKPQARQVAMVDSSGMVAAHTGSKCIPEAGHELGKGFSCQGNIMKNGRVWRAMAEEFRSKAALPLPERLMASLEAGQREGGDLRGKQSAAMLVVGPHASPAFWEERVVDIRVEDSPRPLKELRRLLRYQMGYNWMNKGDDLLSSERVREALDAYSKGLELVPEEPELKYWVAVGLLSTGKDKPRGLRMLREVCKEDRNWVRVTQGIVKIGTPPLDPGLVDRLR